MKVHNDKVNKYFDKGDSCLWHPEIMKIEQYTIYFHTLLELVQSIQENGIHTLYNNETVLAPGELT